MIQQPLIFIDTRKESPIYLQIMEQIRDRVGEGSLLPGAVLPSVRQLASELELNPNTVAKAYMLLEKERIVETRKRRGCFVADTGPEEVRRSRQEEVDGLVGRLVDRGREAGVTKDELLEAVSRRFDGKESK